MREELIKKSPLLGRMLAEPILKNFFSLGILQFTNYLIPLITVPYLLRVVGVESFGKIAIVQAVMNILIIVIEYGFNLTATRLISQSREDAVQVARVFSETITSQFFLLLSTFSLLVVIVLFIPQLQDDKFLYINGFSLIVGQILLFQWFYQGMERMKFITYLNGISKLFVLLFLFLFVKDRDAYIYVLPIYSLGNVLSGLIGFLIIKKNFGVVFRWSSLKTVFLNLKNGFPVFASSLSINIYMNVNILILKMFTGDLIVGYYSAAEKIMQVIRQLLGVYSQAIYPRVCNLVNESGDSLKTFFKKYFMPFWFFISILCLAVFLLADFLPIFLIGKNSEMLSTLIRILIVSPVIVCLNVPFYQTLLAYNFRKSYAKVMILASILSIILNIGLGYIGGAYGTAVTIIITEVFVTAGLAFSLKKLGNRYSFLS